MGLRAIRRAFLTPVNVVSLVLAKVESLAWAYLFVIAFSGWLARERPRFGRPLVALAAGIDLVFLLVLAVDGFVDLSGGGVLLLMLSWLGIAKWVLLLWAFALGLPSTAPAADPDEPDDGAYGRSTGSDDARFRSRLRPSSTCSVVA